MDSQTVTAIMLAIIGVVVPLGTAWFAFRNKKGELGFSEQMLLARRAQDLIDELQKDRLFFQNEYKRERILREKAENRISDLSDTVRELKNEIQKLTEEVKDLQVSQCHT